MRAGVLPSLGHSPPFHLSVSGHFNTVLQEWGRGDQGEDHPSSLQSFYTTSLAQWMGVSSVKAGDNRLSPARDTSMCKMRKYIAPPISLLC